MEKPDFNTPIGDLELSFRATLLLNEQRDKKGRVTVPAVSTLGELISLGEKGLLARMPNRPKLARQCLLEIQKLLIEDFGLQLGQEIQLHERCIVFGCKNHKDEGTFVGDLCGPCHQFIVTGEGDGAGSSQVYRNAVDRFTRMVSMSAGAAIKKFLGIIDK